MILEQINAYLAYCRENGLDPRKFESLKNYCENAKTEE